MDGQDIFGLIVGVVIIGIVSSVLLFITSSLSQEQCKGYIAERDSCNQANNLLEEQKLGLENQLSVSDKRYINLTTTNITKDDINQILNAINQSRHDVTLLNTKFESYQQNITKNYLFFVKAFTLSLGISVFSLSFLFIDLVVASFTGIELKDRLPWVRKRKQEREAKHKIE